MAKTSMQFEGDFMSNTFSYEDAIQQQPNTFSYEDAFGDDPPKKKSRTWGEAFKDTGAALAGGVTGLVKTAGDLYGLASGDMDNAVSELGRSGQEYWEDAKSDVLKAKIAQRKKDIDAQESTLGKAWTAVKDTVTDPALAVDTVAENAATMLPGMAAGRLAAGARMASGLRFGPLPAASQLALEQGAGRIGTGVAVGVGAAQQGADVSGDIYSDVMKKPDAAWDANPEFAQELERNGGDREAAKRELAMQTARASFLPAAGVSVLANAMPGASMLERALVGGAARETIEAGTKYALPKAIAKGALGEGAQEFVEEGGGRLAANIAAQNYADPSHDTWDQVGENAGMGAAGGLLMGGVGGALHRQQQDVTKPPTDSTTLGTETNLPADMVGGGNAKSSAQALLGRNPDAGQQIIYPDGTIAYRSEMENAIRNLPEDQQIEARARLAGYALQPVKPEDTPSGQASQRLPVTGPLSQVGKDSLDIRAEQEASDANSAQAEQAAIIEQQLPKPEPKTQQQRLIELQKLVSDYKQAGLPVPHEQIERELLLDILELPRDSDATYTNLVTQLGGKQSREFDGLVGALASFSLDKSNAAAPTSQEQNQAPTVDDITQAADTEVQTPTLPVTQKITQSEENALRDKLEQANPFKTFLRKYGISDSPSDVIGDNAFKSNQVLPRTFRNNGMPLDLLAEKAVEYGFITQNDFDSGDGVAIMTNMIQNEINGKKNYPIQDQTQVAQRKYDAGLDEYQLASLQYEANKLGIPFDDNTDPVKLNDQIKRIERKIKKANTWVEQQKQRDATLPDLTQDEAIVAQEFVSDDDGNSVPLSLEDIETINRYLNEQDTTTSPVSENPAPTNSFAEEGAGIPEQNLETSQPGSDATTSSTQAEQSLIQTDFSPPPTQGEPYGTNPSESTSTQSTNETGQNSGQRRQEGLLDQQEVQQDAQTKPAVLPTKASNLSEAIANRKAEEAAVSPENALPLGEAVSTFTGKHGKGMGLVAAKQEAQRLNSTGDGSIVYAAEEHSNSNLEHPYAVVGRRIQAQQAATPDVSTQTAAPITQQALQQSEKRDATPENNTVEATENVATQYQAPDDATWQSMTPDQRRRNTLEQAIATGVENNGVVMVKLRPAAIAMRKQQLAAMGDAGLMSNATPATTTSTQPEGVTNGNEATQAVETTQEGQAQQSKVVDSNTNERPMYDADAADVEEGSVIGSLRKTPVGRYLINTVKEDDPHGNQKLNLLAIENTRNRLQIGSDTSHMMSDDLKATGWNPYLVLEDAIKHVQQQPVAGITPAAIPATQAKGQAPVEAIEASVQAFADTRKGLQKQQAIKALDKTVKGQQTPIKAFVYNAVQDGATVQGEGDSRILSMKDGGQFTVEQLTNYGMDYAQWLIERKVDAKAEQSDSDPNSFVPAPDGSIDYGEITPEMAKAMRRQGGKIRLQQGVQNSDGTGYGLTHIESNHGDQIRGLGYKDIPSFVTDAVRNFDEIWKPKITSQIVAIVSDKKGRAIYLQLSPATDEGGDFYRVNSAFPVSKGYAHSKEKKEGWKPLWSRYPVPADASGASGFVGQSPNAGGTTLMVSSQSGDSSIASPAPESKPAATTTSAIELTRTTPEQVKADEERAAKAEKDKAKADKDAENKAKADAEQAEFTLTGSDRPADVAEAAGQGALFDAPKVDKPAAEAKQTPALPTPQDGWESNIFKARAYAKALIDAKVLDPAAVEGAAWTNTEKLRNAINTAIDGSKQEPKVTLGTKSPGDVLVLGDGTIYSIDGIDTTKNKIRALRNPNTLGERSVLLDQLQFDKYVAEAKQTREIPVSAAYLKDFVYNLKNIPRMTDRAQVILSSQFGKSGRDTLLMGAYGLSREEAHNINNGLDSRQPKSLRFVDMQDAFDIFDNLGNIVYQAVWSADRDSRAGWLRDAGYTDNDQNRVFTGGDWSSLSDSVRSKLIKTALKDESKSASSAIQDYIDGKRPDAPSVDEVKAEQTKPQPEDAKDSEGNRIFKVGERVAINDKAYTGESAGRHGVVSQVTPLTMTTITMFGNQRRTSETTYHYEVKTDGGHIFSTMGNMMELETGTPPVVTPDILIGKIYETPGSVLRSIEYARSSLRNYEGKLMRAKVEKSKKEYRTAITQQQDKIKELTEAFDTWAKANPEAAQALQPKVEAKPSVTSQAGTTAAAQPGIYTVTKTKHTKTGADIWVAKTTVRHDRDEYNRINSLAKRNGGTWSNFTKGFNFSSEGGANDFLKAVNVAANATNATPDKVETLGSNEVKLASNPYVYGKDEQGWYWRGAGADNGARNRLKSDSPIIAQTEAALAAKIRKSEPVTPEVKKLDDLNEMFDTILAEEIAKDKAKQNPDGDGQQDELDAEMQSYERNPPKNLQDAIDKRKAEKDAQNKKTTPVSNVVKAATDSGRLIVKHVGDTPKPTMPTVSQSLTDAAKNTASGLSNAIDALGALFGGNGTLRSGLTFDEETYAKAKPLFQAALANFKDAGNNLTDAMRTIVRMVMDKFGTDAANKMKPYVVQFVADVRDGKLEIAPQNADTGTKDKTNEQSQQTAVQEQGRGTSAEDGSGTGVQGSRPTGIRDDAGSVRGGKPERNTGDVSRGTNKASATDYKPGLGGLTREGSWFDTAKRNIDLIELAIKIESEKRQATPEEQAQLAKYVGFGAGAIRNELFPVPPGYAKQREPNRLIWPEFVRSARFEPLAQRIAALPREWQQSILQSSQYAHYTSEGIIRSVWAGLQRMGFTGGKVFEPGMGIGSFAMLMPDTVRKTSSYTGVEFDAPTALIAKLLSPQQNMLHGDFIKRKFPKNFFDVNVGNPPFSQTRIFGDPDYAKHGFMLHDFFFAKGIDMVRPGGIQVFVTSKGTMDKQNDKARKYLAERADLLGAIRLPSTAFEDNAGTSVVTDVIFLRKRAPGEAPAGQSWGSLATVETKDGPVLVNEYFAAHPEMVLGQQRISGNTDDMGRRINSNGMGGEKYTVVSYDSTPAELDAKFSKAIENLPQDAYSDVSKAQEKVKNDTTKLDFDPNIKHEGVIYLGPDGTLMRVGEGVGKPLQDQENLSDKDAAWLKDYVGLRELVQQSRFAQVNDGNWEDALKKLNTAYDAFRAKHGPIKDYRVITRKSTDEDGNAIETQSRSYKNKRLWLEDYDSALVTALEVVSEDGSIVKAPILLGRTIGKPVTREVKTIGDALAVSLDSVGTLNIDDVAERMKLGKDDVIESLGKQIYQTPDGTWQLADEYLSGNVVQKLAEAEEAARLNPALSRNVEALKQVQPEKLGPSQIGVKLGASWVPVEHVNDFAKEIGAGAVQFDPITESWQVIGGNERSGRSAAAEYGTASRSPSELLEAILNSRSIKVMTKDADGKVVLDTESTTAANEAAKKIKDKFKSWVWSDSDRASELVESYNTRYNNIAPRKFDGSHLTLPGVSLRYKLHPHQLRAIWRIIQTGNTYLAHAVGAGKTIEMIAAGMEQKRLGFIKKPMYVVPNQMLEQFSNEFMDLYPLANIMVADDQNFSAEKRKAFIANATLNNPDAIIITHDAFQRIGVKEESIAPIRDAILSDLEIELASVAKDSGARVMRSKLEQQIESVKQRFDRIVAAGGKDATIKFEDMGVDFVFADEAHAFRKLDFHTAQQIKGIDSNGSKRALDMYIKTRILDKKNPGRSMVFASGTPVTNTMGELYTIMRFFAPDAMDTDGTATFDAWSRQFGEVVAALEPNAASKYETVERFAKFDNVPELMSRVRQFMDVLTSDNLGALVKRPDLVGGKPNLNIIPITKALVAYMKNVLAPRIEISKKWKPSPQEKGNPDPIVKIITDGRFAALDPRFFGEELQDGETSIITEMGDKIAANYHETKDKVYFDDDGKPEQIKGSTQIVFYNLGFGEQAMESRGFDARAAFTKRLTAGGIPRNEIAWFDDANTDAKKEAVFKDMRSGKLKVLIGSAKKMGTGVNVQKRLAVLHYQDPPWYPADVEQPHGRIIRQGNKNEQVKIEWYTTKGTYQSTMWQMVARKQRFIDQAFTGDKNMRSMDDVGEASLFEQAAAVASGDPRAIQLAGLKQDVERFERLQAAHANEQIKIKSELRNNEWYVESLNNRINTLSKAFKAIGERYFALSDSPAKVNDVTYSKPGEFGQALKDAFNKTAADNALDGGKRISDKQIASLGESVTITMDSLLDKKDHPTGSFHLMVNVGGMSLEVASGVAMGESVDATGLARRILNQINGIESDLQHARKQLVNTETEISKLRKKAGSPFEYQKEMVEKYGELKQLEDELRAEGGDAQNNPANVAINEKGVLQQSRTTTPAPNTPVTAVRSAITQAYGNLLGKLEGRGLVQLTQTQDEAIEAAAKARAKVTGESVATERETLLESVKKSAAMRLWIGSRTINDFLIPETEEYEGSTTGDLAYVSGNDKVPKGPLRVTEGRAPESHRGRGIRHMADNATSKPSRMPQRITGDLAEDLMREAVTVMRGVTQVHEDDSAFMFVNNSMRKAIVAQWRGNHYSVISVRPFQGNPKNLWGNSDWNGRLTFPIPDNLATSSSEQITGATRPNPSRSGQEVKSERFNLTSSEEKKPTVTYKKSRKIDIKRSTSGHIQGFFDPVTGKSFLIANNLTAEAAPGVLIHEIGIHMGADGSLDKMYARAKTMTGMNKGNPFFDEVARRMEEAKETSGEEYAAYITELYERDRANAPNAVKQWFKDLLATVRAWLFKRGMLVKAEQLTEADIAAVARSNARSMSVGRTSDGIVKFSKSATVINQSGGKIPPMSPSPAKTPLYEAIRQLSRFEDSFQTGTSDSKDLSVIAREMTAKDKRKSKKFTVEKSTALQHGKRKQTLALNVELENKNVVKLLDIFDSDTDRPFVVIGNEDAGKGVGGATAYQIAFAWAHNNGKTMRPDPAGITQINRLRRTEAMISSAMHYGTTKHLEPHQDQYVALLDRMKKGGVEPEDTSLEGRPDIYAELTDLKEKFWKKGDSPAIIASNVQHLLETSTRLAHSRETALRHFEVANGVFRVRNGREGALHLANLAVADEAEKAQILGAVLQPAITGVGNSTLRRAAVSMAIGREFQRALSDVTVGQKDNENRRSDVVALQAIRRVFGRLDLSTPDSLRGVIYSRATGRDGLLRVEDKQPDALWYSELSRQVQSNKSNSMPAGMWKAWIDSLTTKGVSQADVQWSGVKDYLAQQQGKISKDELLNQIDTNGKRVQNAIVDAVDNDFEGIIKRMKAAGVLEVECD